MVDFGFCSRASAWASLYHQKRIGEFNKSTIMKWSTQFRGVAGPLSADNRRIKELRFYVLEKYIGFHWPAMDLSLVTVFL